MWVCIKGVQENVCTYVEAKGRHYPPQLTSLPYFFRDKVSPWAWNMLICLDCLASELLEAPPVSASPLSGLHHHTQLSMWALAYWFLNLMLVHHFIHQDISPAQKTPIFLAHLFSYQVTVLRNLNLYCELHCELLHLEVMLVLWEAHQK